VCVCVCVCVCVPLRDGALTDVEERSVRPSGLLDSLVRWSLSFGRT
jgi:hypothetical protein